MKGPIVMTDYALIKDFLAENGIYFRSDVTGKTCTTFRAGGPVALFCEPNSVDEALLVLKKAEEHSIPYFIIGNGSNLLIPDGGSDMLFIKLSGELAEFTVSEGKLICGAGASFAAASKYSVASGLMGLEWAAGIPGTVGGAVAMNAGAYGGEVKQVLKSVTVYKDGKVLKLEADREAMGYRHSPYSYPEMVVLEAVFELAPDDGGAVSRMEDYSRRRREKQPLNYPSAGSTFKRPEGYFAGALIEGAGLKGFSVGGASVSKKHAGFVINHGEATAGDILELISRVRETVLEKYGVLLEPEVKILSEPGKYENKGPID